ncbi:MAG: DUF4388 domain-containing protein [Candidatus Aminicenantes bacterium]|nr:DUF4388 domain-containing protein [Candidatus Aminicenantes bacterium]
MAFKGTLKEFKVPDILQLFSLQGKTGILTFTKDEGFITLIFEHGLIVGVDSFPKKLEMRVGYVLVKQDLISEEMLTRALAIQKRTKQKIGEILVGMGLIDEKTIAESLKTQAGEIVLSLFKWKKGDYDFKVIDRLDESMKIIEPMPTDNIIMEGVQMLDEWPLIKKLVPDEHMVFEPIPVETKNIEIIDEYEEDTPSDSDKIYLNATEANMLKYINGKNSVRELVELGIFTEYKVYKCLYKLIRKSIIRSKKVNESDELKVELMRDELKAITKTRINKLFNILLILFLLILVIGFFKPLNPLKSENVLLKTDFYEKVFIETGD